MCNHRTKRIHFVYIRIHKSSFRHQILNDDHSCLVSHRPFLYSADICDIRIVDNSLPNSPHHFRIVYQFYLCDGVYLYLRKACSEFMIRGELLKIQMICSRLSLYRDADAMDGWFWTRYFTIPELESGAEEECNHLNKSIRDEILECVCVFFHISCLFRMSGQPGIQHSVFECLNFDIKR